MCWNQPSSSSRFTRIEGPLTSTCMMMVEMRDAQQFRQHHAGLPVAQIVRLQTGQDQIRILGLHRGGKQFRDAQRVKRVEVFFFDVNRAVRALGQRFANGLRGARRTGAQHHHFSAMLFFQLKRLFESVSIRLVDLEAQIGFLDPSPVRIHAQLRVADRNLLDRDDNFHEIFMRQIPHLP